MDVKILKQEIVFDDYFQVESALLQHEKFDGEMSEPMRRLRLVRGDAVAAVIFHREKKKLLLCEQFRFPTYGSGNGWLCELVAGMLAKDEDPKLGIQRELLEEIGYQVDQLELISYFYPAPGGVDERIFLFYGEVDESHRIHEGGGLDHEHEDIRLVELDPQAIMSKMMNQEIVDAKTLVGLLWFLQEKYHEI